jgi:hypothetical protein
MDADWEGAIRLGFQALLVEVGCSFGISRFILGVVAASFFLTLP